LAIADASSEKSARRLSLSRIVGRIVLAEGMGLEDEKERTNVVISKEEITPSTFVPKNLYPKSKKGVGISCAFQVQQVFL
jgi:hypothetical protein